MNPAEYETMFRQEDDHWWYRGLRAMIDLAMERIPDGGRMKILDVGCGTGANAVHLSAHHVTCLDYSGLALAKCRARGLRGLVLASATALPLRCEQFDVVTLLDVLQHQSIGEPERALGDAAHVLRPGGLLIANVPAYEWLRSRHDRAVHTTRRFTRPEVRKLLISAGFHVEFLTYWNSTLLVPVVVSRKLPSRAQDCSDTQRRFSAPVERGFAQALRVERAIIRRAPLPFGVSIFAVAAKQESR